MDNKPEPKKEGIYGRKIVYTKRYTPQDYTQKSLFIDYRNHLIQNQETILKSGYPDKPFPQYLNLDLYFSKIYPTKLPVHLDGGTPFYRNRDYMQETPDIYKELDQFHYSWSKTDPLPIFQAVRESLSKIPFKAVEKHILPKYKEAIANDYESAAYLTFLSNDDIERITEIRESIFNIKVDIIDYFIEFISNKINLEIFHKDCFLSIQKNISPEEFTRLLTLDAKYHNEKFGNYITSLYVPKIHNIEQTLGLSNIYTRNNEINQNAIKAMILCGGLSDILYTINNLGFIYELQSNAEKLEEPDDFMNFLTDFWKNSNYNLTKLIEEQESNKGGTDQQSSIDETLKKYLPILEQLPMLEKFMKQQKVYMDSFLEYLNKNETLNLQQKKPEFKFQKSGDMFEIRYKNKTLYFKDSLGFRYLHQLVKNQGKEVKMQLLISVENKKTESGTEINKKHVSDLIDNWDESVQTSESIKSNQKRDPASLSDYNKRVRELNKKIEEIKEEKKHASNIEKYDDVLKYEEEIEQLKKILIDIHNTEKDKNNEAQRNSVANAINRAIKDMEKDNPVLGYHFRQSVKKGYVLWYSPADKIDWDL